MASCARRQFFSAMVVRGRVVSHTILYQWLGSQAFDDFHLMFNTSRLVARRVNRHFTTVMPFFLFFSDLIKSVFIDVFRTTPANRGYCARPEAKRLANRRGRLAFPVCPRE